MTDGVQVEISLLTMPQDDPKQRQPNIDLAF
jgi:hypothetical protein